MLQFQAVRKISLIICEIFTIKQYYDKSKMQMSTQLNHNQKHIIFPSCSVMYQNSESIQGENDVVKLSRISKINMLASTMKNMWRAL